MRIKLKNGSTIELSAGSTAKDLADTLNLKGPGDALGACVNGTSTDLIQELSDGDHVVLWSFADNEGRDIFWHTSAHLLAQAVLRLWPEARPTIGPSIQDGFYYDFANLTISDSDFPRIEKEMKAIVAENLKPRREVFENKRKALEAFSDNIYKKELIKDIGEEDLLTAYRQGDFFDLCRGPHLPNLGKIKALQIMKTSGAYWRGDPSKEMLTRIYGIAFPDRKQLKEHLYWLEEAKKRDHKVLGPKLDLFSLKEEAPGMPFMHPKGMVIWNALIDYWRECHREAGYAEIKTPALMTRDLWELSGHWEHYKKNMFISQIEDRDYAIKPMNCPGACLFFRSHSHSYREFPWRVAEIGNVHRYEHSGALSGLFRCRSFHQDDAHIFMRPSDIESEILGVLSLTEKIYTTLGLSYQFELSTRPDKGTIGSDEDWERATIGLAGALKKSGHPYRINEGDGAFYGPKIDIHVKDALNRTWQCGTVQLDMALPEKFNLYYTEQDGSRQRPVMIHRVIYGSIERFFGILIEHFAGKLPLWLSPRQVRILTVAERHAPYAKEVQKTFVQENFHCEVDDCNESVSKKIRNAQMSQINYILTTGDQEVEHNTVNLRTRDNVVHGEFLPLNLIKILIKERNNRALQSPLQEVICQ